MASPALKIEPIVSNDDTRTLTILYGSLRTLIAFFSLVVAAMSWWKARCQRLAAQMSTDLDHELESNSSDSTRSASVRTSDTHDTMPAAVSTGDAPYQFQVNNSPPNSTAGTEIVRKAVLLSQTTSTNIDPNTQASAAGASTE